MTSNQPWWLSWPAAEVAATILPLFAHSPSVPEGHALEGIISWCQTGQYRPRVPTTTTARKRFTDPNVRGIAEAIQVLEHAGLLMRDNGGEADDYLGLTRLGRRRFRPTPCVSISDSATPHQQPDPNELSLAAFPVVKLTHYLTEGYQYPRHT